MKIITCKCGQVSSFDAAKKAATRDKIKPKCGPDNVTQMSTRCACGNLIYVTVNGIQTLPETTEAEMTLAVKCMDGNIAQADMHKIGEVAEAGAIEGEMADEEPVEPPAEPNPAV
jgi:hypothetical protein